MPIVTVQMMEGVLSPAEKQKLLKGITDAVVDVYGAPMRLFMHVVIQEVRDGDWIAGGTTITADRVRKIAPNVGRGARRATPKVRAAAARSR